MISRHKLTLPVDDRPGWASVAVLVKAGAHASVGLYAGTKSIVEVFNVPMAPRTRAVFDLRYDGQKEITIVATLEVSARGRTPSVVIATSQLPGELFGIDGLEVEVISRNGEIEEVVQIPLAY